MSRKSTFCFLFLLLFVRSFFTQEHYSLVNFFNEDKGISSEKTYDVTQDLNGFIWVATDNGISRFDGKKFHLYSVEDGLPSNDVLQVFVDKNGRVWANCYMKPLSYFNEKKNRFEIFGENKNLFNILWRYKYNRLGNYQSFYENLFIEINDVPKLTKNSVGYPIFATKNTFLNYYKFQNSLLKITLVSNGKKIQHEIAFDFTPVHTFYFMGSVYCYNNRNELYRYTPVGKNLDIKKEFLKIGGKISQISFSQKNINFIGKNGEIYIVDGEKFQIIETLKTNLNPNNAFIDKTKNIWVATVNSGLYLYKKSTIRSLDSDIYKNKETISLHIEGDDIFSGNYFGEYFKNNKRLIDLKNTLETQDNIRIKDIIYTSKHKILISERLLLKNLNKEIFPPQSRLSAIKSSILVNDSFILLGTSNGLFRYNPETDEISKIGQYTGRVIHLAKMGNNDFIFATSNELFKFNQKTNAITKLAISKYFDEDFISGLETVGNELLWISTDGGNLVLFKNLSFLNKINYNQGISNNIKCVRNSGNTLYIGTHTDGLIKMKYQLKNERLHYNLTFINSLQGLPSNTINAISFKKDSVVVATSKGVAVVPENYSIANERSKPIIIQTKIDGEIVQNESRYFLKKNQRNISFIISSVDFVDNFTEIQYAINEKKNWTPIKENVLNIDVSGGEETIYLRTVSRNKSLVGGVTQIFIEKERYFYQQYWFWLIFGGVFIGIIVFARSKKIIHQQKKFYEKELERQKLVQKERERISHDMHDDLGAGITALRFQAEFLKRKMNDNELKNEVDELLTTSDEIHKSMREMLWNLRAENDSVGHFVEYAEKYIIGFFKNTGMGIKIEKKDIEFDQPLSSEARRNLFLCLKEVLNNALKHSKGKKVEIRFSQETNVFEMCISDDGEGIESNHNQGNGLRNMQTRMHNLDGEFHIENTGKGTKLTFKIPI